MAGMAAFAGGRAIDRTGATGCFADRPDGADLKADYEPLWAKVNARVSRRAWPVVP